MKHEDIGALLAIGIDLKVYGLMKEDDTKDKNIWKTLLSMMHKQMTHWVQRWNDLDIKYVTLATTDNQ